MQESFSLTFHVASHLPFHFAIQQVCVYDRKNLKVVK